MASGVIFLAQNVNGYLTTITFKLLMNSKIDPNKKI